jgi:Fic family protein
VHRAADQAQHTLDAVIAKARFWQRFAGTPMNERHVKLLNRLRDGFEDKLTTSKWSAIAKCSPDGAARHQRVARAGRAAQGGSGRAQHPLRVE